MAAEALPAGNSSRLFGGLEYKWLVAIGVVFGVFPAVLDTTVANIALAKLQAVFGVSLDTIQWVITGYTLAQTVSIPIFGYLADRYGVKWVYIASLTLFTIASALCGLAWSASSMIVFRVLQGLGGGALLPLGFAQIFAVFPPSERGAASSAIGIPVLFAPAIGPTLGGYIVQHLDWRLIFYLNLPIGIAGVILCASVLRVQLANPNAKLDLPGILLSSVGFASLVYGIGEVASTAGGWHAPKVLAFISLGVLCLILLVIVELRTTEPLLDMRLFLNWNWTSANLITWAVSLALFGILFMVPLYLQSLRGLDAFEAGLVLLPSSLVTMLVLPLSGRITDRFGPKWSIVLGLPILGVASILLSRITLTTPTWLIQVWLMGRSVGIGFCMQPTNVIALGDLKPQQLARASSFYNVMRQVVAAFSTSFLATYIKDQAAPHFQHLAEQTTPGSSAARWVTGIVTQAAVNGQNTLAAQSAAVQQLVGRMRLQATVMAYRDAFLLIAVIAVIAFVLSLFVGNPRAKGAAMPME